MSHCPGGRVVGLADKEIGSRLEVVEIDLVGLVQYSGVGQKAIVGTEPQARAVCGPVGTNRAACSCGAIYGEQVPGVGTKPIDNPVPDRKSTRLNSSHRCISYAVF